MIPLIKLTLTAILLSLFYLPPVTYKVGDEVADFTLKNVDGKLVSLSSFPSAKGFILVFTSNRCPVAKAYDKRLIALHDDYVNEGYPLILINPNDPVAYAAESFEKMQQLVESKRFAFQYLQDIDGEIAANFGATRTPEAFVLNNEAGKIILRYTGKIDDNAHDSKGTTRNYVREVLEILQKNEPVKTPSTKAIGCSIKWEG
jgi:peroxiredoxin